MKVKNTKRTCPSCTYRVESEKGDGWCELHEVSASTDTGCPDYHQRTITTTPPLIRLTKKQRADVQGVLKGMTLSGAMALAIGDESRFEIIHDRQKAIIHALEVLGINSGEWES